MPRARRCTYELRTAEALFARYAIPIARHHRVLDRGDRQPHPQHHRNRATAAPVTAVRQSCIVTRRVLRVVNAHDRTEIASAAKRAADINSRPDRLAAQVLCVIVGACCSTDTQTVVSWRARPRSFVALMGLYESNFIRLGWLAGDLARPARRVPLAVSPSDCDLVLTVTERSPYTSTVNLTYLLPDAHGALQVPRHARAHLPRRAPGRGAAVGRTFTPSRHLQALRSHAERELDQRWARNMMLNKWLEYCVERGHRFSSGTESGSGA